MSSLVANRIVFDHKKSRHTLNGRVREGGHNKRKFTLKYPLKRKVTPNINKGLTVLHHALITVLFLFVSRVRA